MNQKHTPMNTSVLIWLADWLDILDSEDNKQYLRLYLNQASEALRDASKEIDTLRAAKTEEDSYMFLESGYERKLHGWKASEIVLRFAELEAEITRLKGE